MSLSLSHTGQSRLRAQSKPEDAGAGNQELPSAKMVRPKSMRSGHSVPLRGGRSEAQRGKVIGSMSHSGKWPVGEGFKYRSV